MEGGGTKGGGTVDGWLAALAEERAAWPLAGRSEELDAIGEALARPPAGVLLVGDAGVGKTRLLREALARLRESGRACDLVVATRAAASIPFGALAPLLPAEVRPDGNPLELLGRVSHRLARRPDGGDPVAVGVDDAHLIDEASAALLHQLAGRALIAPVITIRQGEPVSDAVLALWKESARTLQISPLPVAAVDELLDRTLGGPIDPISRARLRRLADGNPLMLRELLADGLDSGTLRRHEGVWRWEGWVRGPSRLTELVAARLRAQDASTRAALEVIACGEPLPLAVLERLADPDAVHAAERSGLVVPHRSGARTALRLAHPLYGESLRASIPASRARVIWGHLAGVAMAGPLRRRDDMLLAGVWELQSGTVRHPEVLLAAARHALGRFDLDLAERLARAARGAAPGWDADWVLAQVLTQRARPREALATLPTSPPADEQRLAMWAVARAGILYWGLNRTDEAERTLLRVPVGSAGWDLAESSRSWVLFYDGRCRAALDAADAVLSLPNPSDQAVVWAAMAGTAAAGALGLADRAAAIAERGTGVAGARADRLPWALAQIGYGRCYALAALGALVPAREVADDGYRAALAGEAGGMTGLWAAFRGFVAKAEGRLADARSCLLEAVALLESHDEYQIVRVCLAELAGAAALGGDGPAAARWLERAEAAPHGGANRIFDARVELDRAWVQAASGEVTRAAATARRAADLARLTEQPTFEATALYDAARLGAAGAVRDRLSIVASQTPGPVIAAQAGAAAALASGEAAAVEEAALALEQPGHLLQAGEAWAAAARRYKCERLAVRSRVALERAAALVARCQGARTPLLVDLSGLGPLLTPREREIAMLAVGMRSRDIADRLGLSVHTVNNALARVFAKVGVHSRRDLGAALGRHDLSGA